MNQQTLLPADVCVEALIVAGGNTRLAAERLFGPISQCPNAVAWLVASIAQDPFQQEILNNQLRTLVTLQAFDTLNATKVMMDAMLTELDPADFVKFYTALTNTVTQLTAPPVNARPSMDPAQLAEALLSKMPPNARRAFLTLVEGGSTGGALTAPEDDPTPGNYVGQDGPLMFTTPTNSDSAESGTGTGTGT